MADIKEAIRRLIYQYTVEGADKVLATQEAVAASTTKTDKASLSLEKAFGGLERKYVDTVRAQQDYAKVQEKVNAAVAQNPDLQERANAVLAAAGKHFDNVATGATKGSVAANALAQTLTRTIGPLALVGVAVAAISSAMEFMEPIAVRVGTDIYKRFSQAYPAAAQFADGVVKVVKQFIELEHAKAKVEAIDAAMKGVASSAELAALKLESVNQKLVNQRGLAEAALAAERMADATLRMAQTYPGMSLEAAKQLQSYEDLLRIAQARGTEEELTAKQIALQNKLLNEGKSLEEAIAIAVADRRVAEENIQKQADQQAASQRNAADAAADMNDEIGHASSGMQLLANQTIGLSGALITWTKIFSQWGTVAEEVAGRLSMMGASQFNPQGYTSTLDPLGQNFQRQALENQGIDATAIKDAFGNVLGWKQSVDTLDDSVGTLTSSTDALNNTMQNALSPFYSQDPRTTHLGFRAGVVGNPDWQISGASNENPLAAILGPGATAPGMADGGSFIVGGGYSANDNRIAAFPVASGEEVVVNRDRARGQGGQVIHIDNRTIVTGPVDTDTLAKLKVSKFQQAQRMRAGLAQAS